MICRRDSRIRRPYRAVIERTADGIPYLAPEVVLLFKAGSSRAKQPRDKDEADLLTVLPDLDRARLRWLDDALAIIHPTHPWRDTITSA